MSCRLLPLLLTAAATGYVFSEKKGLPGGFSGTVWFNGQRLADVGPNRWCPRLAIESVVTLKPGHNELLIKCGRTEAQVAVQGPPDPRLGTDGADLLYRDPIRFGDDPFAWFPW